MDDFGKYLKSMLDQFMKSGMGDGSVNFDVNSLPPFMRMFFGDQEQKEKLAIRKLSEEEVDKYKELIEKKNNLQSQFKRLISQNKIFEAESEIFWQDIKDSLKNPEMDASKLSINIDTGFLFQEVNVKEETKEPPVQPPPNNINNQD